MSGLNPDGLGNAERFSNSEGESLGVERTTTTQLDRAKVDGRWGERFTVHGSLLDSFEDLTNWTASNGTLEADTSRVHRGTQSAKMTPGTDGQIIAETSSYSVDLTQRRFAMACWLEDDSANAPVNITLIADDSSGNTAYFTTKYVNSHVSSRGWRYLDFPFGQYVNASIDLTDIQNIRVHVSRDIDGALWVDGLKTVPTPSTGKLAFTFDDGNAEDYTMARPILAEHGYTATAYVHPSTIGETGSLSEAQVKELHEKEGWTIGSHLWENVRLRNLTEDEKRKRIEDTIGWLQERGLHDGAVHLAPPGNEYDQDAYEIIQEYHVTTRLGGGIGYGYPLNPMSLGAISGDDGLSSIQSQLDFLANNGGVGVLFFHSTSISESAFRTLVEDVYTKDQNGNLDVINIDDIALSLSAWHTQ